VFRSANHKVSQGGLMVISLPLYLFFDHRFSVDLMITDSIPAKNIKTVFVPDGDVYAVSSNVSFGGHFMH
jgi:hypothetical protein